MIRALVLWLLLALPTAAQDLPDWQHTSINDFAGLLTAEDTEVLDKALIALNHETGVEGTVVTLTDRARYGGSDGLEPFATRLFNHWGIGHRDRNDGFMVLVLQNDREARIELGAGYPPAAGRIARQIMDGTLLPEFRQGNFSRGIREGTLDVIQHIARPHAAGETLQAPARKRDLPDLLVPFAVFGIFAFVGTQILRGIIWQIRRGRQPCPNCGGTGLVQQEELPAAQATDGKRANTRVVWNRCPTCGWTSPRRSEPIRSSRSSGGRSGGFGGGRSSGGGASGRW